MTEAKDSEAPPRVKWYCPIQWWRWVRRGVGGWLGMYDGCACRTHGESEKDDPPPAG